MASEQARILIIDDDAESVGVVTELCTLLGHRAVVAAEAAQAVALAQDEAPDLVLLDLSLNDGSGLEVLRTLKAQEATRDVPVIAVTALTDMDAKLESIEAGADDYLTKPFKLFELQTRLNTALQVRRYQDRLRDAERALADRTQADPVTGAGQDVHLHAQLDYEVSRARRYGRPLAALMLGLDAWEDRCAQADPEACDAALAELARGVRAMTRRIDRLFRVDADAFVVVLPETPAAGARVVADRILAHLQGVETPLGPLAISLGGAGFPSPAVRGGEDLLQAARRALRAAQAEGGGQVVFLDG